MERSKRIALIGIGNILFCDEGIGAYAIEYVRRNFAPHLDVDIIEGSALGFDLMRYFHEYDEVLLVGSNSKEAPAGTVFIESADKALRDDGVVRRTANEAEIMMMVEITSVQEKRANVTLITMTPKDIVSVRNALSQEVIRAIPELIDAVTGELQKRGVFLKRRKEFTSIERIVSDMAMPKAPRCF